MTVMNVQCGKGCFSQKAVQPQLQKMESDLQKNSDHHLYFFADEKKSINQIWIKLSLLLFRRKHWVLCLCFWLPPNPYVKILAANATVLPGGAFAGWLGPEGKALPNGISASVKEACGSPLAGKHLQGTRELLPATEAAAALIWDCPASRIVRNIFLLFKSFPVSGILLQKPKWSKALSKTEVSLLNLGLFVRIRSSQALL